MKNASCLSGATGLKKMPLPVAFHYYGDGRGYDRENTT